MSWSVPPLRRQNCAPPTGSSGRVLVQAIRKHLLSIETSTSPDKEHLGTSGPILSFKAYLELSSSEGVSPAQVTLRSELQGSGVSLIDTPKSGRKDVADKMIISDLLAFALDVPPPARIVLLSGDRDFAYPLSLIRGRGYQVVLITPPIGAVPILEASANHVARWRQDVLGVETNGYGRPYASTPSRGLPRSSSPGPHGRPKSPKPQSTPMAPSRSQESSTPSAPATSTSLSGPGAGPVPRVFVPLVQALDEAKREGDLRPLRSKIAIRLVVIDKDIYEKAGAASWRDYVEVAVAAGIVVLGSGHASGSEWIALRTVHGDSNIKPITIATPKKSAAQPILHTPVASTKPALDKGPHVSTPSRESAPSEVSPAEQAQTQEEYKPPVEFEPLLHAILVAERACQRSPPFANVVGEHLDRMIASGQPDPYPLVGTKTFGAYITLAFKARIAKLTPTERQGVAALEVMPAYQPHFEKLRKQQFPAGSAANSAGSIPAMPSPIKRADSHPGSTSSAPSTPQRPSSPVKKVGLFKGLFKSGGGDAAAASPAHGSSAPSPSSSTKRSAYNAGPGFLMAHQPSGTQIAPIYFPLVNALLQARAQGQLYSTDQQLYHIISKHKHVGPQVMDDGAFETFLQNAQKDDIVSLEPGFKAGQKHVRLLERLWDPKDRPQRVSSDTLPSAGSDPYDGTPSKVVPSERRGSLTGAQSLAPASSSVSNGTEPSKIQRRASPQSTLSAAAASAAQSLTTPSTTSPSVEDRVRFKPLMDVMLLLRKHDPPQKLPRRSLVNDLLSKKNGKKENDYDLTEFFKERGATSIGDYTRQAEKLGFVVCEREARQDGEQGKRCLRLSDKYEALFNK